MKDLIAPPALRPGDGVAIVAPAGPAPEAPLAKGLAVLAARYRVKRFDEQPALGYLAASDEQRLEALHAALRDGDVRAIFCARGGFGCTRLLPELDPGLLRADPKIICGFSDITALLGWWLAQGIVAVHGPVVTQLGRLPAGDQAQLFALLEQPDFAAAVEGRLPDGRDAAAAEPVEAALAGGNLSLLGALAGTPFAPVLADRIVLLEEVGEAPYRLDRLLTNLRQQAEPFSLDAASGVALGALTDCKPSRPGGPEAAAVVAERLPLKPLLAELPVGHDDRQVAVPLGVMARLDPANCRLSWRGGAVSR